MAAFRLTVATLLQAHPEGWAFECLGPSVPLELEPTEGGLIIECGRYTNNLDFSLSSLIIPLLPLGQPLAFAGGELHIVLEILRGLGFSN